MILFPLNRYAWKVWYRDLVVWSRYWHQSLLGTLGEPILYFLAIGYGLGSFISAIDGMPYVQFLAPALVASAVMNSASFETTFSSFTRMETQKTYHSIAVTPVNVSEVIVGEILWGATKSVLAGGVMLIAIWFLGFLHSPWSLLMIPLMIVEGFLFASFGMLMTSFAQDYDFFTYYFTLVLEPMFLFSGTFFPIHSLPSWAARVAWILPLTHPVSIARALAQGEFSLPLCFSFLYMLVLAVILSTWSVRRMVKRLVI